ncbi:la protein homolog [Anthonomus grandis grandis]|uniref:la protein homolog n=1 Tax=Anthonomus grandis grandis TaxID=2921223 RepID=UPI002166A83F|nr:la protein homolog [Anthonomus grandis grandis]
MASDLEQKIIRQVHYYFGDINLPRDKFLQEKIKENEDGWVPLEVMLKFKRLASLSEDSKVIAEALEKSEEKLVLVNEDKTQIKRNPEKPLPANNEEHIKKLQERSAYAKGFPLDTELNEIINFMEEYGPAESVIRRTDSNHKFKGSCFIVFKDVETAKKFVELESVKFKDNELLRKMQQDYHSDKKKEIEDRKKQNKEKKQALVNEQAQKIQFPNGAVVQFTGIAEGKNLTREEIKEKLKEVSGFEVVYIDFNKGDTEGYARFSKENNAVDFVKKLTDGEVEVAESKLKVKALEGDEEKEYLKKTSEAMASQRQKQKNSKKRKGGNHGGGRNAKHAKRGSEKE